MDERGSAIKKDEPAAWVKSIRFSAVGIELALGIVLGYLAGAWLDKRYDTYPYLTMLLLFVGIIAGFRALWRVVKEYGRQLEDDDDDGAAGP